VILTVIIVVGVIVWAIGTWLRWYANRHPRG
jgi:hypothetical protein